jgi:hypothetical protein
MQARILAIVLSVTAAIFLVGASRPPDIPFQIRMIDDGANETAAVADLNNDGHLDIISGENWYEGPAWTKHKLRDIEFTSNYVDNFTDIALDVDGDGWVDVVQFGYFSGKIVWLKNPGKRGGAWTVNEIDATGPTEFALLVDLNNDGKAQELLPQFDRANAPLAWFELQGGKFVKHVISSRSYTHGIGVGDVNGDGRNDILTPQGWFEAPPDVHAPGEWTFHSTDWADHPTAPAGATPVPGSKVKFGFLYAVDVNGDGRKDIVTTSAHDYGVWWFEQTAAGGWTPHVIDNTWSQAHASALVDLNGDGQLDLVTGKRYMAHNGNDPGEREPLGMYWYEYRKGSKGAIEWTRHLIDYGSRMGGGMQIVVKDLDGDGKPDIVTAGKSGLFVAMNKSK